MFFDHDEKKADVIAIFSPLSKSKITREMTENAVMKGGVSPKGKEPPHGFKNTKKRKMRKGESVIFMYTLWKWSVVLSTTACWKGWSGDLGLGLGNWEFDFDFDFDLPPCHSIF